MGSKMRIYYWKSATGSTDLLADHDRSINDLLNGDYSPHDLEKLRTGSSYPIYSFRLNRCDRLLFTTHKNCLHVLEFNGYFNAANTCRLRDLCTGLPQTVIIT